MKMKKKNLLPLPNPQPVYEKDAVKNMKWVGRGMCMNPGDCMPCERPWSTSLWDAIGKDHCMDDFESEIANSLFLGILFMLW